MEEEVSRGGGEEKIFPPSQPWRTVTRMYGSKMGGRNVSGIITLGQFISSSVSSHHIYAGVSLQLHCVKL